MNFATTLMAGNYECIESVIAGYFTVHVQLYRVEANNIKDNNERKKTPKRWNNFFMSLL